MPDVEVPPSPAAPFVRDDATPGAAQPAAPDFADGTRRSTLVDAVRGMAIILVVVGHTGQGMSARGLWHGSSVAHRLDAWMYTFHMPAFFFMGGLFLLGSLAKRGTGRFLRDRTATLLWPYLLFSLLNLGIAAVQSRNTHAAVASWSSALLALLTGAGNWFLPALLFALACFAVLRWMPLLLLLLLSLVARRYCLALPVTFAASGLFFLPFVVLGATVGMRVQRVQRLSRWLAAPLALLLGWAVWYGTGLGWQWNYYLGLLFACAGTAMLLLVARTLDGTRAARWLAWCGEASLGIFLLAPYPQVVVRTLLLKLHGTAALLQLTLPSLAAVLVGGWLFHHRRSLHLGWLFQFPERNSAGRSRPMHRHLQTGESV